MKKTDLILASSENGGQSRIRSLINQVSQIQAYLNKESFRRARSIISIAWFIIIFVGVGYYVLRNRESFDFSLITLDRFLLSGLALLLAKLLSAEQTRLSLQLIAVDVSYLQLLRINSISQLGKYLPGGIWHFAGKGVAYVAEQIPLSQASRAILIESVWYGFSALCYGAMLLSPIAGFLKWGALAAFVIWCGGLILIERMASVKISVGRVLYLLTVQALIWTAVGVSFSTLLAGTGMRLQLVIGAMVFSWAIGYFTVFAPAGLGVREGVLIILLGSMSLSAPTYVALSRLAWIMVEVLVGLAFSLSPRRK